MRRTLLIALVGGALLSSLTWRLRKAEAAVSKLLSETDRIVDYGVSLSVVEADPDASSEVIPGAPPMRVVRTHNFGGCYDTLSRSWVGPSLSPVRWYCSVDQEPVLLHGDELPPWILFSSGFGAGKSTTAVMWAGLQVIRSADRPLAALKGAGVTAPTDKRMEDLRKVMLGPKDANGDRIGGLWPRSWFTWREGDQVAVVRTGLQIDFRTTHVADTIQGQNWPTFQVNDELQDYFEQDSYLQARGRGAWKGRHPRFATVTPRDNPGYRSFRAQVETSPDWHVAQIQAIRSPFVWPEEWEKRRRNTSPSQWAREVLGHDLPSETRIYNTWSRADSLRVVPHIGAEDVTRKVLADAGLGSQYAILCGHDPGSIVDYTCLLKAYRLNGQRSHTWFVVGELVTSRTTSEEHGRQLLELLREKGLHRLDLRNRPADGSELALIMADPYSERDTERKPDKEVYTTFRNLGLHVRPAAFAKPKIGARTIVAPGPGQIPKKAGIETVVRLLKNAEGERRLYVACDEQRQPVAPELVRSFESQEYDAAGKAETARKRVGDTSHPVAALRYALWQLEAPRWEVAA